MIKPAFCICENKGADQLRSTHAADQRQRLCFHSGLSRVREKSGKLKSFQGQEIVREFCKLSGKLRNIVKCQGIVREF